MTKRVEFLKNAIMGKKVGAIASSSSYVIKAVLKHLHGQTFNSIVEYGPGDGVLTKELLKLLSPNGKMLVVEMDKNFVKVLEKINDKRLIIISDKMQDVSENLDKYIKDVDLVVSSVPFSLIPKVERAQVVKNTHKSIKDTGKFIIFHQYSLIMLEPLKKHFKSVKYVFEPRNILPCFIMVANK